MKIVLKISKLYLICLLFLVIIPRPAEAYGRNPDEVAKLQKFVNSQIKKGAKLPKDAKKIPLMYNIAGMKMDISKKYTGQTAILLERLSYLHLVN